MRAFLLPSTLCLALLWTGCAGYHLGPTQGRRAGGQSVQVNPFFNKTMEPRLSEPVTTSLRRQLQNDGTFVLNTDQTGDVIVEGTILGFDRKAVAFQSKDTRTAREYQITITAQVTARERSSGRTLVDRKVDGHASMWIGEDLVSAERQTVPLVAEDLARNITSLLVDGDF